MNKVLFKQLLLLFSSMLIFSCFNKSDGEEKAETASMEFRFSHTANGQPLVFDTQTYSNSAGNTFTISQLNYHVSEFKIKDDNGDVIDSSLQAFPVNVKNTNVTSFVIDDLPPIHFHTVNFAVSPVHQPSKVKEGSSRSDFFLMDIALNFQIPTGGTMVLSSRLNGVALTQENEFVYRSGGLHTMMEAGKTIVLDIEFDILKIFNTPNVLNFSDYSATGNLSGDSTSQKLLRDNIRKSAFEVKSVTSM